MSDKLLPDKVIEDFMEALKAKGIDIQSALTDLQRSYEIGGEELFWETLTLMCNELGVTL